MIGKTNKTRLPQLQSEQNAQTAYLKGQFAEHPSRGLTPARLAEIFLNAEQGYLVDQCDLFEDMEEKDGHIVAELGKRKRALLGLEWSIKAPRNATPKEQELTEFFHDFFSDLVDFDDLILDLAGAIGYGFACCEIEWQFDAKATIWLPKKLHHRPQRWFQLPYNDRNTICLRDGSGMGAELEAAGWLVHKHHAKTGDVSRAGLFRALAFPYLFKNYSVRDLAEFLEIYGLPMRLGTYQSGASDKERATLMQAVVNIGHSAAGIIPEGMAIDFKEAAKGTSDPHIAMIEWCERTQSKVILGATLTSDSGKSGGGSFALGKVHDDVRHDILVSDARQIQGTLTHGLIKLIANINGLLVDDSRYPSFEFDVFEEVDIAQYAEALPKLVGVGVPIPVSYIQDKLRIPAPKEGEAVLGGAIGVSAKAVALSTEFSAEKPRFTADQQVIENLADKVLATQISPVSESDIHNAIKAAKSYEDLEDRLVVLFSESDTEEFRTVLERATFAADCIGYAHD